MLDNYCYYRGIASTEDSNMPAYSNRGIESGKGWQDLPAPAYAYTENEKMYVSIWDGQTIDITVKVYYDSIHTIVDKEVIEIQECPVNQFKQSLTGYDPLKILITLAETEFVIDPDHPNFDKYKHSGYVRLIEKWIEFADKEGFYD